MNICATRTRRRKFMVPIAMAFFALFLGNLTVPAFASSNGNTLSLASGGNLNIISEQNTSSYHYNSDSGGASVSVGAAGGSGSGSFANTSIKDNAASVGAGQQSGLTASRTLNAIIAGNTNLDGGILSAPAGSLITGSLTAENIQNQYASNARTTGLALSSGGGALLNGATNLLANGLSLQGNGKSGSGTTYGTVTPGITINSASGTPAALNRDSATANGTVSDPFNLSKVQTQLQVQQLFGEVGMFAAGQVADSLQTSNSDPVWGADGTARDALHAIIAGVGAALSGGSVGGAVAGTIAGDQVTAIVNNEIFEATSSLPAAERAEVTTLATNIIAGAAGYVVGGAVGGSTGAQSGAGGALNSNLYNQQYDQQAGRVLADKIICETDLNGCSEATLYTDLNEQMSPEEALRQAKDAAREQFGALAVGNGSITPNNSGAADSGAAKGSGTIIYRSASGTPASMTPRPVDRNGLSASNSLANALPGKNQIIDTSRFTNLCAVCDNPATGHVSITPIDMDRMQGWIDSRGSGQIDPLTQELMDSIIGTVNK